MDCIFYLVILYLKYHRRILSPVSRRDLPLWTLSKYILLSSLDKLDGKTLNPRIDIGQTEGKDSPKFLNHVISPSKV